MLKVCKLENFALEGKIATFKAIAVWKIVFQLFITAVPKKVVKELEKTQKAFLR